MVILKAEHGSTSDEPVEQVNKLPNPVMDKRIEGLKARQAAGEKISLLDLFGNGSQRKGIKKVRGK